MNKIKAQRDQSFYKGYPDFLNFLIDGRWLDEMLAERYPALGVEGLIPTLDPSIADLSEQKVVWERILPQNSATATCPVLMCPDDCDFSCSLVVAEIINEGTVISWKRMGFDLTPYGDAESVGSTVKWFDHFCGFAFDKADYLKMIAVFGKQLKSENTATNGNHINKDAF